MAKGSQSNRLFFLSLNVVIVAALALFAYSHGHFVLATIAGIYVVINTAMIVMFRLSRGRE